MCIPCSARNCPGKQQRYPHAAGAFCWGRLLTDSWQGVGEGAALGRGGLGLDDLLQLLGGEGQLGVYLLGQAGLQGHVIRQVLQRDGGLHRDVLDALHRHTRLQMERLADPWGRGGYMRGAWDPIMAGKGAGELTY